MDKILFPLEINMQNKAVANLHIGFRSLRLKISRGEVAKQHYGEVTAAAIHGFQVKNGLQPSGRVDEETAHVLNEALHAAGTLDDFDSYSIRGQVSDKEDTPLAGLLVRAVDVGPSGETRLGQPVLSGEDGRYTIIYYDHQFRAGDREPGNADVVVLVFDPENADKPLKKSPLQSNVARNVSIDLSVKFQPARPPEDDDYNKFVVKGCVRAADGTPAFKARVTAFDVRLRQEFLLGEDSTRADGCYEIVYTRKQFTDVAKTAADLRVRAYDASDQELAYSAVYFNAGEVVEIDLTTGNVVYRGASEYEQLVIALEPRLRGLSLKELKEDDEHADVSFLSGNTMVDPRQIALLIAAHRLADRTDISAEVFYALLRNDLPVDLPSLLIQEEAVLHRALGRAVADNIIADRFTNEIEELPERFKALVVEEAIRPSAKGEANAPLVALLNTSSMSGEQQKRFLQSYVAHSGSMATFWEGLTASPDLGNKVDDLQFTLHVGALVGGHLPLVQALQEMRNDPGEQLSATGDLVRFDEAGWRGVLEQTRPGGDSVGVPAEMPGEDDEQKIAHYARALARRVELSEPTAFVAARLADDSLDSKANLLTFFANNQGRFDITGSRAESYLAETPNALDGIAENEKPALRQQLRAMQRLYRVAPKYTATSRLLKDGITSALDITRMGATQFALKYGNTLDVGGDSSSAKRVYARAEAIHGTALALASSHGGFIPPMMMQGLADEGPAAEDLPADWSTLFGSLELCECEHCRSVYSPAAYFVDVLHFLQDRFLVDTNSIVRDEFGEIDSTSLVFQPGLNAKEVLFQRRGDLGEIELSCENTNTLMPYVDLVNEVLENYVAPPPTFSVIEGLDLTLANDLDAHIITDQLRDVFTNPALSGLATIEVQKAGERWRIHDQSFTYSLRKVEDDDQGAASLSVTTRSRQTAGTAAELAANPQYVNTAAYDLLAESVFPLSLPFDFHQAQAAPYLDHLGVSRSQLMAAMLPGDAAALLANDRVGRATLNLTLAEVDLITGDTGAQLGAAEPGIWNLWGFDKATLDAGSAILNPQTHGPGDDLPENLTAVIDSGEWLEVLTDRVDVFLQQSSLSYKEMLSLLGSYFVNPAADDATRLITVQAHNGQPETTCETAHLRLARMDENAARRSLRFIRLWRKIDWSMQDLDRALRVLGLIALDPVEALAARSFDAAVLTQLSIIERLHDVLRLPIQRLLPFWGAIDHARYIDHEQSSQPAFINLYEQLFRNKSVLNPVNKAFTEDPLALSGLLSEQAATISAALGISSPDLTALRLDANVIPFVATQGGTLQPDDALNLPNLTLLTRHASLAKALRLSINDYLIALNLHGNPFASPANTLQFVEAMAVVRASGLTFGELDYLSRHQYTAKDRIAPDDRKTARVLTAIRADLQQIAADNTFEEDPAAPNGPTEDATGELTATKLGLLGWSDALIDEVVATFNGTVRYSASLSDLPAGVELPVDMPQLAYDVEAGQLQFAGRMSVDQKNILAAISTDPAYQDALTQLFDLSEAAPKPHSVVLVELPAGVVLPIEIPELTFDAVAEKLQFTGVMTVDQKDTLLAISDDLGYQDALVELFNVSVTPPKPHSVALAELPAGISLPVNMPQLTYHVETKQLLLTGVMAQVHKDIFVTLSDAADYQAALTELFEAPRRFVQRNMRSYIIEHFKTPLAVLPAITFPVEFKDRIYHDEEAGLLYFVGAMSNAQHAALLALSNDADFTSAIDSLFAAPGSTQAENVFLSHEELVNEDTDALFLSAETTPADRFIYVLSKLMPHLLGVLSARAVTQRLAEDFELETRTTQGLLTQWLDWAGHEDKKLLSAFLDKDFANSNDKIVITPLVFADQFDAYLRLQKVALIVEAFEGTHRQLDWLFRYGEKAGWPNLAALPLTGQPTSAVPFEQWLNLMGLFALRERLPHAEEMLDDLLNKAIVVDASAPAAGKDVAKTAYIDALVQWTEWPESDLVSLMGAVDDHTQTGFIGVTFPTDYVGTPLLNRLVNCFALLKRLGMSAAQASELVSGDEKHDVTESAAAMIKQAVRAKYDEEQWLKLAQVLRDTLREQQRVALVDYLLTTPPADLGQRGWRNSNNLYSYFLIDVEMDPCTMTSRIKQATGSVQLFVQRCLMNLEPQVLASAEIDKKWNEWPWMKNYRVWEANRKVFLYPENWIEPELRDDKTPFFKDLESELLQSDLTHDSAETAFRSYLHKLDAVAKLDIVGMYEEKDEKVLHVFGRTAGIPHIYYYRRRINNIYWTSWESVDLDIEGDHLIPVVWRGRLYLIWPIITEEARPSPSSAPPPMRIKIQLARSEYNDGKWLPKRVSEQAVKSLYGFSASEMHRLVFKGIGNNVDRLDVKLKFLPAHRRAFSITLDLGKAVVGAAAVGRMFDNGDESTGDSSGINRGKIVGENVSVGVADAAEKPIDDFFRLNGCNSDFVVISEDRPAMPAHPQGLKSYNMSLRENSSAGALYLPKNNSGSGKALNKTLGSPFHILYAHQDEEFTGLKKREWFFNDDTHAYFVTPRQGLDIRQEHLPGENTIVLSLLTEPEDPFYLGFHDDLFVEMAHVRARSLPAVGAAAADVAFAPPGNRVFRETGVNTRALESAGELLEAAGNTTVSSFISYRSHRYTFQNFYHPYLCNLIEALNRNGVDALFQRSLQLRSDSSANTFDAEYDPQPYMVSNKYPKEQIDFDTSGAYSQYNWELFFHAPLLIANSLRQNQRFADAHRWFHYIFDPTDTSGLTAPQRYWKTKPFFTKEGAEYKQSIGRLIRLLASAGDLEKLPVAEGLSEDEQKTQEKALLDDYDEVTAAVAAWREKPFNPHLIARMRTTAYQKTVVMKYIDNLLAWGDQLFRRDTIESINEATQLYVMAADILGKRPEEIPPRVVPAVHTYDSIAPLLGDASNGLALVEEFVSPSLAGAVVNGDAPLPSLPTMLYFCVPKNDNLLAYWDTVADRLFKIRHCMNIDGVERQLALFAPAIDPVLLVRATAAGLDIGSVLNEVSAPLPHYRFNVLAQKATELCGELKSLSGSLLASLEKRDAEKLALLRTEHETTLLKMVEQVREQQLEEADQQLVVLRASREITVGRYLHYQKLLGAEGGQMPAEGEVIAEQEVSANIDIKLGGGVKMIKREKTELDKLADAYGWQGWAKNIDRASSIANLVPNFTFKAIFAESTFGGGNLGAALSALATEARAQASEDTYAANRASRMAQHIMRENDWVLQSNSAAKEIMNTDQQILGADLRKAIADQELKNHRKQLEQAQKVEQTMRDKYTNQELYNWMVGQISTVYFQSYQLAYDVSKRAERAFRHELAIEDASFVQFGYWDSLRKGLLAGDRLHHDIKRMEVAYLNQNKREFEITKQVSLNQLAPAALIQLRETGECEMVVPEVLFDLDYPGHYLRRIKNVSITIPAVTGPYTGVPCTLSLVRSSVRRSSNLLADRYGRDMENDDPRFTDSVGAIQSIVTSSAQNDSGLFETNLRDERFLPFEGAGVISTWRIELPDPKAFPAFDYDTISDVVLHIRYTARPAGDLLKKQTISETEEAVNAIAKAGQVQGLARMFSVRHDFASEWHGFLNSPAGVVNQTMTLPLVKQRFPFLFQGKEITIDKVELFVKVNPDFTATHDEESIKLTLAVGDLAPDSSNLVDGDILPLVSWNGLLRGEQAAPGEPGNWTINAWLNDDTRLEKGALEDVVVVCHYSFH